MKYRDETDGHRQFALPGASLHYGPDKTVIVEHIDLVLEPDLEAKTLDGVCTTTVRALDEAVQRFELNSVDLAILRVERDGNAQAYESRDGKLTIAFDPAIAPGERATFAVTYRAVKPRHGLFFIEPTPEYPARVRHAWTQSQDENARFWFPCLDYPASKQTTSTTVFVPKGMFALANGALAERVDDGARTRFVYRQDVPHPTYLMTLVVGPFAEIEQSSAGARNAPVWYYVLPGREADGERAFGNTPRMIEVFEERIKTPYPYAQYSQIAVEDFIFGGMENTAATTQTDRTLHDERAHLDFSSDPLVSHELAHQWFGDLLTCRDWSHAWLNEGFATYFECVWREADLGYDEYLYDVFGCVARYLDEDGNRYRRPIVCNRYIDPIELFDRHLYEKGGAVLHMLRGELGDARFWRSIARYVEQNAGRNVETIDFIRAIEEATGRNMRGFFDQWVFQGGHPDLEVSVSWDAQRKAATVTIDQKQKIDETNPAYRFDIDMAFCVAAPSTIATDFGAGPLPGERRIRVHVEGGHETVTVPLEAEPKLVRFDPGAFLLGSVTYKFGTGFAAVVLASDPDPVARIRAARELAKDGSKRAQEVLADAFQREPFWGVLEEAAKSLGETRAPWAREILVSALGHSHPKVRRAVATALGTFRDDAVASALLPLAKADESYFVRGAALTSLGKTRDARALDVLREAVHESTWNGIVAAGAARGLAELADERAIDPLIDATRLGRDEGLRRAAVPALARAGELLVDARTRVVDALEQLLDDPMFLVQLAAIAAAESLGDERLLGTLDRLGTSGFDGRVRRDAIEAAQRIREAQKVPAQVTALRTDLDALREDQRKLQDKIEALSRP
ncbi:MAG: HEAT repeat domain-containing protein [Candidatus Eremiobacteraeota bacterium]|nr:HEAT repeat domain-containing protein [Candidatus Eremiobacteraeota bacterium]